jgi:adenylyltransferase/sulfurtransferase
MLSDVQIERYSRQIVLPAVGARGQEALLRASILLPAESAHSSLLSVYLAAAGVGRITLWGGDAPAAFIDEFRGVNPDCEIRAVRSGTDARLEYAIDVVVAPVRLWTLVAELAAAGLDSPTATIWGRCDGPVLYMAALGIERGGGCLHCFEPPPEREAVDDSPLGGIAAGTLASLMAAEVIKLVLEPMSALAGHVLRIDTTSASVETLPAALRADCAACGRGGM